jgi:hypothetical protein
LAKWKYAKHRAQSRFRNIEFNFSFDEWYAWWLNHGVDKNVNIKWTGPERPCMCRTGDSGPYELNNVYFATNSQNAQDGNKNGKSGGQFQFKYRWGNQRVSLSCLLQYKIPSYYIKWFVPENYDHYNQLYSETLRRRYYKSQAINYWVYHNNKYQTVQDIAQDLQCTVRQIKNLITQGLITKQRGRWDITLADYIKIHSYFPDPHLFAK